MSRVVCFGELLLRMSAPGRELLLQSFGDGPGALGMLLDRMVTPASRATKVGARGAPGLASWVSSSVRGSRRTQVKGGMCRSRFF